MLNIKTNQTTVKFEKRAISILDVYDCHHKRTTSAPRSNAIGSFPRSVRTGIRWSLDGPLQPPRHAVVLHRRGRRTGPQREAGLEIRRDGIQVAWHMTSDKNRFDERHRAAARPVLRRSDHHPTGPVVRQHPADSCSRPLFPLRRLHRPGLAGEDRDRSVTRRSGSMEQSSPPAPQGRVMVWAPVA